MIHGGTPPVIPPFGRVFFGAPERLTRIGGGELGGKGAGLCFIRDVLEHRLGGEPLGEFRVEVPRLTVLATDVFDRFLADNRLGPLIEDNPPDDRLALAFQKGSIAPDLVGDLRALVQQVRSPLAIRSSSLLEDALGRPFAGVYATKMIPNNQPDADSRFRRLTEAIKFVYASTYFAGARRYRARTGQAETTEKMAVVIQEVVGRRHLGRFYPDISGVARSWNFYRYGRARPDDGVVVLALGLGKTIVDGGVAWSYSPRHPRAQPPFASARATLEWTQREFWAVNMGAAPAYDPTEETEYLVRAGLDAAEFDGVLRLTASTYDGQSDRIFPGIGRPGPRAVTFAPLLDLEMMRLNHALQRLIQVSEEALGGPVEIEFAVTIDDRARTLEGRIGFLQVRPMVVPSERVEVRSDDLAGPAVLVSSDSVLGNGLVQNIRDVVYVKPEAFEPKHTRLIVAELEPFNRRLVAEGRPYVLIGFGRWGSVDPWLGIPVDWGQISGARAIVEAQIGSMRPDPSQGSHFFHNLSSFDVSYFSVPLEGHIDWAWLAARAAHAEATFVRHLRLETPLTVKVDGRSGRGAILKP